MVQMQGLTPSPVSVVPMRPSRIKTKLREGEPVLITTRHLTDASIFELPILMEMGARVLFHGADLVTLKLGQERIQQDMAPLGFQFDNRVV